MEIVNLTNILETDFINHEGRFTAIVMTNIGIISTVNNNWNSIIDVFRTYTPNSLMTIEFTSYKSNEKHIVFARNYNKVLIADVSLLRELRLGDVISWQKTNLYCKEQNKKTGAKKLNDYVFIMNVRNKQLI